MHLLFFLSEYSSSVKSAGGIATYTKNLSSSMQRIGVTADIIERDSFAIGGGKKKISAIVEKVFFPAVSWERRVSWSLQKAIEAIHRQNPVDIVQIPEFNGGAAAFSNTAIPLVVRFHTPSFLIDNLNGVKPTWSRRRWYKLEGDGIKAARALTASSFAIRKIVCSYYGINEENVKVLRNPVDTEKFTPSVDGSKQKGSFRILFCGRLEERKGMSIIEKALPDILKGASEAEILFVGFDYGRNGVSYEKILSGIAGKESKKLTFTGPINRDELVRIYQASDLFIIPSLFDNSPNSLFEAMSCGLPVVGANTGGIDEIIDHEKNGLLFDIKSSDSFVDAVLSLYKSKEERVKLGLNARNKMVAEYSMEASAMAHLSFYYDVINERQGRA